MGRQAALNLVEMCPRMRRENLSRTGRHHWSRIAELGTCVSKLLTRVDSPTREQMPCAPGDPALGGLAEWLPERGQEIEPTRSVPPRRPRATDLQRITFQRDDLGLWGRTVEACDAHWRTSCGSGTVSV